MSSATPPSSPPPSEGPDTGVLLQERPKTQRPQLYKVIMLNDDYTPMEFVVFVLEKFFGKDEAAATQIMLQIHQTGMGSLRLPLKRVHLN